MRIKLLLGLLLFLSFSCFSQEIKTDYCQDGQTKAKTDVANGILRLFIYENMELSPEDYNSFRRHTIREIMEQDYGIRYENSGEYGGDFCYCYDNYMDSIIDVKFGNRIDKRCKIEVDSMNAIEQQNALTFYSKWDGIMDSLCSRQNISECDSLTGTIILKLEVDTAAHVQKVTITKSFCPGFEDNLVSLIKSIAWTPATGILGKKTETKGGLNLIFKRHKLDKFDAYFY